MIQVQNLSKQYNPPTGIEAVKNISFTIQSGEIFSLLGPNGAGKTTTISMLSCLLAPTSGDVLIDGHSIITASKEVKQVIGLVPQEIALYPTISAYDNLAKKTRGGWGAHAAVLDVDIGPMLQVQKL